MAKYISKTEVDGEIEIALKMFSRPIRPPDWLPGYSKAEYQERIDFLNGFVVKVLKQLQKDIDKIPVLLTDLEDLVGDDSGKM